MERGKKSNLTDRETLKGKFWTTRENFKSHLEFTERNNIRTQKKQKVSTFTSGCYNKIITFYCL